MLFTGVDSSHCVKTCIPLTRSSTPNFVLNHSKKWFRWGNRSSKPPFSDVLRQRNSAYNVALEWLSDWITQIMLLLLLELLRSQISKEAGKHATHYRPTDSSVSGGNINWDWDIYGQIARQMFLLWNWSMLVPPGGKSQVDWTKRKRLRVENLRDSEWLRFDAAAVVAANVACSGQPTWFANIRTNQINDVTCRLQAYGRGRCISFGIFFKFKKIIQ